MRVCEVTPYSLAQLSGVSTVVADLARELVKRGNSAAVVAPGPQVSGASATFEQWPINLHHSLRTLEFSLAVARLLIGRRRRWDMLHVHQAHLANLGAVVVSRVLGKPAVATFHSVPLGTTSFGGMLERTSQSIIPRLCAGVAFVSEQTQREFGIGGQVIHNGVDPDRFPRTTNSRDRLRQSLGLNGFVVAFSGRRTRSKGYFDLLRAISRARTAGVDVRLIAMGDSSAAENDKAQSLARELGLSDSLRDLGRREDSSLVLRAADAFALPSYHEGLPLGILEALAAPLPIVASNVGGIPEIIRDGKEGFLLPPGDVEGLAERLVRLARNPFLAASLAENARERAKSFTLTRTVESYVRFYQAAWNRSVAGRGNP